MVVVGRALLGNEAAALAVEEVGSGVGSAEEVGVVLSNEIDGKPAVKDETSVDSGEVDNNTNEGSAVDASERVAVLFVVESDVAGWEVTAEASDTPDSEAVRKSVVSEGPEVATNEAACEVLSKGSVSCMLESDKAPVFVVDGENEGPKLVVSASSETDVSAVAAEAGSVAVVTGGSVTVEASDVTRPGSRQC